MRELFATLKWRLFADPILGALFDFFIGLVVLLKKQIMLILFVNFLRLKA